MKTKIDIPCFIPHHHPPYDTLLDTELFICKVAYRKYDVLWFHKWHDPTPHFSQGTILVLHKLDLDIMSVKQMTAKWSSAEGPETSVSLFLFVVTLTQCQKLQTVFALAGL
jgi:hypothetical protein